MFASNIITDLPYNLNNYIQFEVLENFLKWVAYINTVLALLSLGSKWKVAQMFAYPNNSCIFSGPELSL